LKILISSLECWDDNPDNRPSIHEVVERLIVINNQKQDENLDELTDQIANIDTIMNDVDNVEESSHGELFQLIREFGKMDTNEIKGSMTSTNKQIISQNILPENDLIIKVNEITEFMLEELNKNGFDYIRKKVIDYINNQIITINLQEIYNWLCNNQNYNSNSIFLLGYFNYHGIESRQDCVKAFNLFINASKQDHVLAQCFVGWCYVFGYGTNKDEELALEYYIKVANNDHAIGQLFVGICYEYGLGINKEPKDAFNWYKKAANNGNLVAMCDLGIYYEIGYSVEKNKNKAIYWFKKAAEQGHKKAQHELDKLIINR
jgi:hypothetical protein